MESFYAVADGQTTICGLLPLGGKTDPAGMDVCADRVSIFAMQGNHMGPKKKSKKSSNWGQGNMMSDSQDERELCTNMFVQNCVTAAKSCRCPLVIGLGLNCYGTSTREMFGHGYKDRANAIHKQVWDSGTPCLPGDCFFNQINNHPDYTINDLFHADLMAKDKRAQNPAAVTRFYTENACDGDPANKAMATMVLFNSRIQSGIDMPASWVWMPELSVLW